MALPITLSEFSAALGRCVFPVVAVANSAGPDSTCLLFLLRQIFPPSALLSIHVRHDLQPASPHMAATAAQNAHILGIPHHDARVPWGVHPFPPLPHPGAPIERTARDARYLVLFRELTCARVSVIALAHHADDQLETAIMRLALGSSLLGAAGMRPLRRWGMGSGFAFLGHRGLRAFIIRPLLPFPKDRILATCHAHHLHYINDPSNLQPHITLRNTIRHCLRDDPPFSQPIPLPPTASLSFDRIRHASSMLQSIASDVVGEKQRLYAAVTKLATRTQLIDQQVTHHLAQLVLPSPPGTILLSSAKLRDITDPDVRHALVLRVLRYISFHPWGSLRADANRRHTSILRVVRALWPPSDPLSPQIKKFTAGAGVLWSPAIFSPNKSLRVGNQRLHSSLDPEQRFCWLASRTPPFSKNPQQGAGSSTSLSIDLTEQLKAAISSDLPTDPIQVLYDCRFLLCIHPFQMPAFVKSVLQKSDGTASIKVLPHSQYYWPKVIFRCESRPDQVLAVPQENSPMDETEPPPWITIQWVRLLDAA